MKTSTQVRQNRSSSRTRKQALRKSAKPPAEFKIVRLRECPVDRAEMTTPDAVETFWREHVATAPWFNADKECLVVFLLNTRRQVLGFEMLSLGTKDTLLVNTGEVFRLASARNASAIITAHNHPSGNPSPSEADIKGTRDLIRAGAVLKIQVLDHVIIGSVAQGRAGCSSLRELGYFYDSESDASFSCTADAATESAKVNTESAAASAAPGRAALPEQFIPAKTAIDMIDAMDALRAKANAAGALVLMCADVIQTEMDAMAGWQNFNGLPGFEDGVYDLASTAVFRLAGAVDAFRKVNDPLAARLQALSSPTSGVALPYETEQALLRAGGCEPETNSSLSLEDAVAEMVDLLSLVSNVMERRKVDAWHLANVTGDKLKAAFDRAWKAQGKACVCALGAAAASVEHHRQQAQRLAA